MGTGLGVGAAHAVPRHRRRQRKWRHGRAVTAGSWRSAGRSRWRVLAVVVLLVSLGAAVPRLDLGLGFGSGLTARRSGREAADLVTAAARRAAVRWVARQVSRGAIVACDPAMCSLLETGGLPAANMLVLRQGTPDPLGSDVVVATAALREQFGSRLAGVYAPAVIASFGAGTARIDVRTVAPDGAAAYRSALSADLAARRAAGAQLLLNARVSVSPRARRQLASGQPDARLLITLGALATLRPLYVLGFDDSARGASPGMPARSVSLAANGHAAVSGPEPARQILAFLHAQRAPFLPARAQLAMRQGGRRIVRVEFAAPNPLGLLNQPGSVINVNPQNTSR